MTKNTQLQAVGSLST